MRMWDLEPKIMCRKHLLGEHVEMHMFIGVLAKKRSIFGYINKKLVNPAGIRARHDELAREMLNRGYNHKSPIKEPLFDIERVVFPINHQENIKDLITRCSDCNERYTYLLKNRRFSI